MGEGLDEKLLETMAEELTALCLKYRTSIHLDGYFHDSHEASDTTLYIRDTSNRWRMIDYTGPESFCTALKGIL